MSSTESSSSRAMGPGRGKEKASPTGWPLLRVVRELYLLRLDICLADHPGVPLHLGAEIRRELRRLVAGDVDAQLDQLRLHLRRREHPGHVGLDPVRDL